MLNGLTNDGDAAIPTTGGHAWTGRPDTGQWVVSFHAAQAGRAVETAAHVKQPVIGADAQTAPLRAQRRDRRPLVAVRVVTLGRGQVHDAVVPNTHANQKGNIILTFRHTNLRWHQFMYHTVVGWHLDGGNTFREPIRHTSIKGPRGIRNPFSFT